MLTGYRGDHEPGWLGLRLDAILKAWPDPSSIPTPHLRSGEDLSADLESEPGVSTHESVLVIDARRIRDRDLLKAIDRLRSAHVTGLVLVEDLDSDVSASSGGLVVRSASTPDAELASALHAVCSCDEAASELRRELRISQKTTGGVREEMSRMSQELSLASRIQQELVPTDLPAVDGMDFGVLYRPAGYVSGDIYNLAEIDDRRVAFFIADAVGHGVPAALLTMIISRSLPMRGCTIDGTLITPADALGRLNDELCDVSDGNPRFATAVYGIIDRVSGLVRIANAGHPQPLRISSGEVAKVEAGGPLLGVFQEAEFEEEIFELREGETLLMYSDGFETAFPEADAVLKGGAPSPSAGYVDHLLSVGRRRRERSQTIADALRTLETQLDGARGSLHQADDVTALAIERTAVAQSAAA
ncbi:MAG: SpoIIE family protein phosphatase [Planctomycetota bacterium]